MFLKKAMIFLLIIMLSFSAMTPSLASLGVSPPQNSEEFDAESINFFGEAARTLRDPEDEEEAYVSSIILTSGSGTMIVDGEKIPVVSPETDKGRNLLPVADIAEALGAQVDIDDATGEIAIMESNDVTVLDTPLPSKDIQLYDIQKVAEVLTLDYAVEGENIVMTRPFQSKMLLVILKPGKKLTSEYGATDIISDGKGRYALKYDSISQAKEGYDKIKALPDCQNIMPNRIIFANDTPKEAEIKAFALPVPNWGAERIHSEMMKDYLEDIGKTNDEIIVAVMDSGVLASHSHLADRIVPGRNFSTEQPNNPNYTTDINGHGTLMSGNIVTCTPNNVKIMPVKVLSSAGTGLETDLVKAIKWVVDENDDVKIINMSLGVTNMEIDPNWDLLIRKACEYAVEKGATIITAAGNAETGKPPIDTKYVSPARLDCVITVAATDVSDNIAYFSNFGDSVNISAPGTDIVSSGPSNKYYIISGTSVATTFVSAAAAMFSLIEPGFAFKEIKEVVEAIALDLGDPGWDRIYGWGIIDFELLAAKGMLKVGSGVVGNGGTITVPVMALDSLMLSSLSFLISYQNETMKLTNVTLPDNSVFNMEFNSINSQDLVSLTSEGAMFIDPNDVLLYLTFELFEYAGVGNIEIFFADIDATGIFNMPIQLSMQDGSVKLIRYGDANSDNLVNGFDTQAMVLWINAGRPAGEIDEAAARITSASGRPDGFDVQDLALWINAGGNPLVGHPGPNALARQTESSSVSSFSIAATSAEADLTIEVESKTASPGDT
ncbi:MAG: S8 family serine peptidase, partial [Oscillospiraceae bacterium]|nr:S8 family serine peptidase [Oscillospiraceae bacterium]